MYKKSQSYDVWFLRYKVRHSEFFVILGHFLPFYHPHPISQKSKLKKKYWKTASRYYTFTHVYHKWQSYDVWFLRYRAWRTDFVILDHFLPFNFVPLMAQKIKIFQKFFKKPGDIIILEICTINENRMVYGSWDMECDREFFVTLDCFCPFTTLTTQKITILKKSKKLMEILSFYTCVPKMAIIWCMVSEI